MDQFVRQLHRRAKTDVHKTLSENAITFNFFRCILAYNSTNFREWNAEQADLVKLGKVHCSKIFIIFGNVR